MLICNYIHFDAGRSEIPDLHRYCFRSGLYPDRNVAVATGHCGDTIIVGSSIGRIRTMTDDKGNAIKKATPSTPIEITGLPEVPEAGELFYAVKDEKVAKHLVDTRRSELREKAMVIS